MTELGTPQHPLRVAVIGAGPSGFFLAEKLLGRDDTVVHVDLYERLPAPYGLVRFGVAPDHEKIRNVTRSFDKVAERPGFRFFGNVEIGCHLTLDDLRRFYHQVCFTTGAQTDRQMGIPGEDLPGSHAATEFVAWYNGHPDYRDRSFDLSVERVAVVGVGNVAVDVARILCRTPEELAGTDIADYALDALARSRVREVYLLGRRGPAQAAFTNAEVKELGELAGADVHVLPEEAELDPLSHAEMERAGDRLTRRKVEIIQQFARRPEEGRPRKLTIRFLVSPVEVLAGDDGRVAGVRLARNRLEPGGGGTLRPVPTGEYEDLPVQLLFRSVGYRGVRLEGLPFDERRGIVPNQRGRVIDPEGGETFPGVYVSGWIKRGPSGVIGTNKPDAAETAETMLEDAARGAVWQPEAPEPDAALAHVLGCRPECIQYQDWLTLSRLETERGQAQGRPRVKLTSVAEVLEELEEEKGRGSRDAGT